MAWSLINLMFASFRTFNPEDNCLEINCKEHAPLREAGEISAQSTK